jgi:hypothetical protein
VGSVGELGSQLLQGRTGRVQLVLTASVEAREIVFGSAQGRLSLRLKNGSARDDATTGWRLESDSTTLSGLLRQQWFPRKR